MQGFPDVAEALPTIPDLLGPTPTNPLALIEKGRDGKRLAIIGTVARTV
jgi:hypothetical protein